MSPFATAWNTRARTARTTSPETQRPQCRMRTWGSRSPSRGVPPVITGLLSAAPARSATVDGRLVDGTAGDVPRGQDLAVGAVVDQRLERLLDAVAQRGVVLADPD